MPINNERESNTLVDGKYFRVHTISTFVSLDPDTGKIEFESLPIAAGLSIERKQEDGTCYVVAFVEPDSSEEGVVLNDVCLRTVSMIKENMSMETVWEMMQEYKNCVEFAQDVVLQALGAK